MKKKGEENEKKSTLHLVSKLPTTYIKVGKKVTLNFETDENVDTPTVTIAGNSVIPVQGADKSKWSASYTFQEADTEGFVSITIDTEDFPGNAGAQRSGATEGNNIVFDKTSPTVGGGGIITTSGILTTSLTLNWTKSTDNYTSQANLQYKQVRLCFFLIN